MKVTDLLPFCSKRERIADIASPWSAGEFTFATNGVVLIRVPRLAEVLERTRVPETTKAWPREEATEWHPVPDCEVPEDLLCPECKGSKRRTTHCFKCNNEGKMEVSSVIMLGPAGFQARYLKPLSALPNCQVGTFDERGPVWIRFDGGDGVISTCHLNR